MSDDDKKGQLDSWLDPQGDNFMGTGLNLSEALQHMAIERFTRSLGEQERPEKTRRMKYIVELSATLQKIYDAEEVFGTAILEGMIEDIITGDWRGVDIWTNDKEGAEEYTRTRCPELYAQFLAIARRAYETRPGQVSSEVH